MASRDPRADKQDISEVMIRYATGIDRRDWALFRTCFTDDVIAEYDGIATWNGVEEITGFMEAAHESMGHTMHSISNIAVTVDGDTATGRCHVDATLMSPDGESGVSALGFYEDELVRTAEGWRISHRRFVGVRTVAIGSR